MTIVRALPTLKMILLIAFIVFAVLPLVQMTMISFVEHLV